jgi:hypothetical protein
LDVLKVLALRGTLPYSNRLCEARLRACVDVVQHPDPRWPDEPQGAYYEKVRSMARQTA